MSWEGAWQVEAAKVGKELAENRLKLLEVQFRELRVWTLRMLASFDGWHEEDCYAFGAGADCDLPSDPSDADERCTCERTYLRNQVRAIISATELPGTPQEKP